MPLWLGIDPGLAILGWAVLQATEGETPHLIDYGVIETAKTLSTPQRLLEIEQDLQGLIQEFKPQGIAIEMPYFNRQIKAAGGVMQALGIVNLVCWRDGGIEPIFLHQSSWKCHLGNGKATKTEVGEMIAQIFALESLPLDDAVDAIAIAYAALSGLRNEIH
jgi:crossover junction endodeoxyribonuclease RuvC